MMENRRMESTTNIYFIGSAESGAVKIGMSVDPESRLAEIQRGHPNKLKLYKVVENVTKDYEMELHKMFNHIRQEGEWFELNDELIHFMINKTDETYNDYKINNPSKNNTVDVATNRVAKGVRDGSGFEGFHEWCMRKKFISQDRTLISKLGRLGIHVSRSGGEWFYLDNRFDKKTAQLKHYICPAATLNDDTIYNWNQKWIIKTNIDSRKWKNIKFSHGYSTITSSEDGNLTITTITTTTPGKDIPIVIYKGMVFDASC